MANYDFDEVPDRADTGSLKWNKYAGRDALPLWVADMDFKAAPEILDALHARIDHGVLGYTKPWSRVIESVQNYLSRQHGLVVEKPEHLIFTPGMVPVLNLACNAFCKPGEAVMTCSPVYPPFLSAAGLRGRTLIDVPLMLDAEDRWTFDLGAMEAACTPETRVFILCNPHNPTGRCYDEAELRSIGEFCERHDLVLISDEIHCDLVLEEKAEHLCLAARLPEFAERTITMMAPSKTYNLPGLCCAFMHLPGDGIRRQFERAAAGIFTEVNSHGYAGLMAAYDHGEPWRQELITYLRGNRDRAYSQLAEHAPAVGLRPMDATYLAWMDVAALGLDHPCAHFEEHGVGLSDGRDFRGPDHLRLNFGCPRSLLDQGLERIVTAVDAAVANS